MWVWIQSHIAYVLGGIATVGVLFGDTIFSGAWSAGKWLMGSGAAGTTSVVTPEQAMSALEVVTRFKAQPATDVGHKGVMAAIKAELGE